jgi:sugar lactone lactonase YvrE
MTAVTTHREHRVLVTGLGFPESLRWHDDALWYADWAAGTIFRLGPGREPEMVATGTGFPLCFDLRGTDSGPVPVRVADLPGLAGLSEHPWNEIVLTPAGGAYVNNIGFAYDGSVAPSAAGPIGFVVLVRPDGTVVQVADGLAFPNGMAVVEEGRTLLVAESGGAG